MIGKIKGTLIEVHGSRGYVETESGVSYLVYLVPHFLDKVGKVIDVYTHLQIKDDDHVLFGFETYEQFWLFQQFISINGVGPKVGFTVLSYADNPHLIGAIESGDVVFFESIPGIGKKTAARMVLDLSGKLARQVGVDSLISTGEDLTVVEALTSLGFPENQIRQYLQKVDKTLSLEERIRQIIVLMTTRT